MEAPCIHYSYVIMEIVYGMVVNREHKVSYGIDACFTSILGRAKETACFTSILGRAKETAHHCLWAFSEQPLATQPKKYVSDYRLNERHYGSLQGFVKCDVENEIYGHDSQMVKQLRRNWHAIPPVLDNDDPRRIVILKSRQFKSRLLECP